MNKYKPGNGWSHTTGPVYTKNGVRVHLSGVCRKSNGEYVPDNLPDAIERQWYISINGGNRKRGLMAWANTFMETDK